MTDSKFSPSMFPVTLETNRCPMKPNIREIRINALK